MDWEELQNYIIGKTIAYTQLIDMETDEHMELILNFRDGSSVSIRSNSMYEESGLIFDKGE